MPDTFGLDAYVPNMLTSTILLLMDHPIAPGHRVVAGAMQQQTCGVLSPNLCGLLFKAQK